MATSSKGFGTDIDWAGLSQQYWNSFSDMTQQAMAGLNKDRSGTQPWHEGLEQWSRMFKGSMGRSDLQSALDQMLDHGRGYLRFMQELAQNGGKFEAGDLRGAAQRMLDELKAANPLLQGLPMQGTKFGEAIQQMVGWWQQSVGPAQDEARSWLRMPAFGMAREYQEQAQAYAQAQIAYQEASSKYHSLMAQALESGIERFQVKLEERGEQGRGVENLRGLYDVFIDGLEEAYAEMALTEDFRRAYGALVDAQSRLRLSLNKAVEQMTGQLGMPTRTEVNTLEQRVHELRRAAKSHSTHPALAELKSEVDELRAELAALKAGRGVGGHDDDDQVVATKAAKAPPNAPKPARSSVAAAGRKPVVSTKSVSTAPKSAEVATPAPAKASQPRKSTKRTTKEA